MALQGLGVATWVGWLFGIILLDRPWGTPSFTSWVSFSSLNTLLGVFMYSLITFDLFTNNSEGMFLNDSHAFAKYVRAVAVISGIAITSLKKVAFVLNAKKLGKVMQILSQYGGNSKKKTCCESILVNSAFILASAGILSRGVLFTINNSNRSSWFNVWGSWGYSIIYLLFAVFPLTFATYCAFAVVVVVPIRISEIFCDFCEEVKELLPKFIYETSHNGCDDGGHYNHHLVEISNILKALPKFSTCRQRVTPMTTATSAASIISKSAELSKTDIVDQFKEIKELMTLTNDALSSLLLWLIVSNVISLVGTASLVSVAGVNSVDSIPDMILLALNLLYCTVLQAGHKTVEMQKKAKLEVHREFLNMPWTPGKLEMEDIVTEILSFEWKLSASGYFTLSRSLASGMFSVVLNYVVIFIQLNIALTDPAPTVCSNNNVTVAAAAASH